MLTNKGAMFGLDARIALAIFGALSVISGAALYSAIQDARATALLTDMNEIGKAWETYYLDTGSNLSQASTNPATDEFYVLKADQLIEKPSGVTNWRGPYIGLLKDTSVSYLLQHPIYNHTHVMTLNNEETWGGSTIWQTAGKCTSGKKCFINVMINGIDSESMIKKMDQKVDNSDGDSKGKLRWWENGSSTLKYRVHLQYAPISNPND